MKPNIKISKKAAILFSIVFCAISNSFAQKTQVKYHEAMEHIATLDKHKAADVFEEILKKDPNHSPSLYQLALLENGFGNAFSSHERLNKVISLNKEFVSESYLALSKSNLEKGDSKQALVQLNKAIEKDSSLSEAYYRRGKIHFERKEFEQSLSDANKASTLNPANADYMYLRAVSKVELNRFDEAILDLDAVIAKNSDLENAYFYRGYCYLKKGSDPKLKHHRENLNKALGDYNTCIKLDDKDELAYYNRGEAHMLIAELIPHSPHHYIDAIADFKAATQLNQGNKEAHFNKALCNYKYGYEDQALAEFQSIIKMDSSYADAVYQVALIKYEYQEYKEALELYNHLVNIEEEPHADTYIYRGYTYYELKQKKEACLDWKKADSLGDKEAHHDLKKYCKKYVNLKELNNVE